MSVKPVHYVLGFIFTQRRNRAGVHEFVWLFKKPPRSKLHAGMFNGHGGKIEDGESPDDAMRREGREESGFDLQWTRYGVLRDDKSTWVVGLYYAHLMEEATIEGRDKDRLFPLEELCVGTYPGVVANVPFLVAMAAQHQKEQRWQGGRPPMHEIIEFTE